MDYGRVRRFGDWLKAYKKNLKLESELSEYFIERHYVKELYPEFISFLSFRKIINSMIDVSDGFLQDLKHILNESCKSAIIDETLIPTSNNFKKISKNLKKDAKVIPLISGEEYNIIFTANPLFRKDIVNIADNFSVKIKRVGEIVEENEDIPNRIKLKNLKIENFSELGYTHSL